MTDRKISTVVWAAGLLIIGFISISAQTGKLNECNWTDSTRDIYINEEIDRAGQLMFCEKPRRYALISSKLDRAIILDLTEKTVHDHSQRGFALRGGPLDGHERRDRRHGPLRANTLRSTARRTCSRTAENRS